DEVATDWPAQLEPVSHVCLLRQIRGDLAVVDPLDGQLDARAAGGRRDRIAPLSLIAVVGGQTDVNVLASPMTGPVLNVEGECLDPIRFGPHVRNLGDVPVQ